MAPKKSKTNEVGGDHLNDEGIKTIHEMISEALMGTTSNGTDSRSLDAHFNTNILTDHETQLLYSSLSGNGEEAHLTLGGLFLKFQNLDFRLSRVEGVISKRDDFGGNAVRKRVTTLPRSVYPGSTDICFSSTSNHNADNSSPGLSTIDPILTSGTDMLNMDSFQGGNSSYSLSSMATRHGKIQRKDEIKRSELDHICLPLLEYTPKPTTEQLQEIVDSIAHAYPDIASKHLLSKVREWFRKRREYMSQRIFSVCAEVFQDVQIETESELEAQISHLNQNEALIGIVLEKADLEIIDQVVAKEYCREKILSYFNGLYKPSSLKNRTQQ